MTVNNAAGASSVPVQGGAAHDAASAGNPILLGAEFDDTAPDSVDEGDVGKLRISANRNLFVTIRDAAGNERGLNIDASGQLAITHAALTELATAIDTEMQVDVVGALPAGDNNIGNVDIVTLPALAAGTNNIGDVDVLSIVPGTAATNLGKAEDAAHTSGDVGVMAMSVRQDTAAALGGTDADYQPLITDGSGRLHVNVGNTVTVAAHAVTNAGTFAVQDATAQASLSVIDDWDESDRAKVNPIVGQAGVAAGAGAVGATVQRVTLASDDPAVAALQIIDNAISGNEMQVDVLTMPTVTVNAHAVTNAGTFATQVDGAALTALQLIDNPVLVDDAAFTPATSSVMMAGFQADEASTDSVDEGDAGAARMTLDRKQITTLYAHAAAGGASGYNNTDVQETDVEIKGSAGKIYSIYAWNMTAGPLWLKLHDALAANVTPGTTAPTYDLMIPANADSDGAGVVIPLPPMGLQFATGITVYGSATRGTTAADVGTAGNMGVFISYA